MSGSPAVLAVRLARRPRRGPRGGGVRIASKGGVLVSPTRSELRGHQGPALPKPRSSQVMATSLSSLASFLLQPLCGCHPSQSEETGAPGSPAEQQCQDRSHLSQVLAPRLCWRVAETPICSTEGDSLRWDHVVTLMATHGSPPPVCPGQRALLSWRYKERQQSQSLPLAPSFTRQAFPPILAIKLHEMATVNSRGFIIPYLKTVGSTMCHPPCPGKLIIGQ